MASETALVAGGQKQSFPRAREEAADRGGACGINETAQSIQVRILSKNHTQLLNCIYLEHSYAQ